MEQCVITGAVRTPVGAYLGGLKTVPAYQLGSLVLDEVVKRGGIEKGDVEQVIMGPPPSAIEPEQLYDSQKSRKIAS